MNVLPENFVTLRVFGLWYEEPRRLWPLKLFHQSLVGFLIINFTIFQLVTLVLMRDAGVEVVTACLFMSLSYVAASYKQLHFIFGRPSIDELLNKFRLEICRPQSPEELAISRRHHIAIHRLLVVRMLTAFTSGFAFLLQSFLAAGDERQLPFNAYEMFNITTDAEFAVAYAVQFVTAICAIGIDGGLDATACSFIILISCQLELLSHRIANDSGKNCKDYALHHNLIFVIKKEVQSFFIHIILPVFFFGLICLCSSIFQLATTDTLSDFMGFLLFIGYLLNQLYYYCWSGNELQFKSESITGAIFRSNWTSLSPLERRNYWFIMFMGHKKLVISYHGQCSLSLVTYIWMLKTSYGAYNLLQQVSST